MKAYIFQAALLCEDCGEAHKRTQPRPAYVDEKDESTYDSDVWPKGPYPDGGGEADSPQHCDNCGCFLENPLTGDGESYVREKIAEFDESGAGHAETIEDWRDYYDYL